MKRLIKRIVCFIIKLFKKQTKNNTSTINKPIKKGVLQKRGEILRCKNKKELIKLKIAYKNQNKQYSTTKGFSTE